MSANKDYLPRNPLQLLNWSAGMVEYVDRSNQRWDIRDPRMEQQLDAIRDAQARLDTALLPFRGEATTSQRVARDEAAKHLKALIRPFVKQFLMFPPVSNEDRTAMGLNSPSATRTVSRGRPTELVEFQIVTVAPKILTLRFKQSGASHNAKPSGYKGAVVAYTVSDAKPATPEDCRHIISATRTPFRLIFDAAERGKTVWVAMCWQNARGERGVFSKFKNHLIP